jgi:hypothetical protein
MAALPDAGVNLEARGFREYLRKLDQIDKQQQEVFGKQERGLEQSFDKAEKSAKQYENQIKKTDRAQAELGKTLQGLALGVFSQQTAQAAFEASKAANAFRGQRQSLIDLAAQHGQSGNEILAAVRRGAAGTVSANQAVIASNQALQLDVAQTPAQLEEIARIATTLATAAGDEAGPALEEFITALGRGSVQILDNFNVSSQNVNAEMERLSQQRFDGPVQGLTEAQRQALFLEAALKVAGEQADIIGQNLDANVGAFDRLTAETENLKIAFGAALGGSGLIGLLADASVTAQQLLALISAGVAGTVDLLGQVGDRINRLRSGQIGVGDLFAGFDLIQAGEAAEAAFLDVAAVLGVGLEEPVKATTKAIEENTTAIEDNEKEVQALQNAVRQAEQLELSFARAAEDAARKLERSQAKLARSQAKDREKLLNDQIKDLDEFEADRIKTLAEAEKDIGIEREKAAKEQLRDQEKLQRQLKQAQERFNLDRVQSERRFQLNDRRLRAEGDILALQELRENHALEQQEATENFGLEQRQTKDNARDQIREQQEQNREREKELEERLNQLKLNLEQERAELLAGFDEQLAAQEQSQLEQRQALIESYNEQQEDARINQQRQIEDLGRSLAVQKDVTAEGALAIAGEIEAVFGQDGVADTIFGGFTARTESEFQSLFDNVEKIVQGMQIKEALSGGRGRSFGGAPFFGSGELGLPSFDDGGIVPGTRGSPQAIMAHGGETVLPTHKMSLPAIPSQSLNVTMAGGFDVRGAEGAGATAVQAAVSEMTDAFEIAVKRMVRRG